MKPERSIEDIRVSACKPGTAVALSEGMNRQRKGVLLGAVFVLAFLAAIALHSMVGAVTVLLSALVVGFVLGIASMRTRPTTGERSKPASLP